MPTYLIPVLIMLVVIPLTLVPVARFLLRGRSNKKLRASGIRAQAQILHVQRTGLEINNQPQMLITALVVAGQESFQVAIKEIISIAQMHQFSPGQTVSIVYERTANGINAALDTGGGAVDIITKSQELLVRLNASGLPARAAINQFTPTGVVVSGDNILVKLDVTVLTPGGTFPSVIHGVFASSGLHKYQAGQEISVRYDPHDLQACTMDLSQTTTDRVDQYSVRA